MKIDRLFADYQLAHMEHNAFNTEASKEKLELAKLAYDSALAKEQEALAPKDENIEPPILVVTVPSIILPEAKEEKKTV